MAPGGAASTRQQGLQQAASVLFALVGIVPLLLFAFTLWHVGAIHQTLAQASLALTLVLMLLGYWLFRSMLTQMSEVVRSLTRAVQAVAHPSGTLITAPAAVAAQPVVTREVTGLGAIWEFDEMARTMDQLWQREARAHVGRYVHITVANAQEVTGRLLEATEDGLLLEQDGGATVAVTYRRVQGIEPRRSG